MIRFCSHRSGSSDLDYLQNGNVSCHAGVTPGLLEPLGRSGKEVALVGRTDDPIVADDGDMECMCNICVGSRV